MSGKSPSHPVLYIIAGPNGAGKTTFASEFLPHVAKCKEFVNADLIANGLSPFEPRAAAIQAGRLMLRRIHDLSESRSSFAFETTLAGRSYAELFRRLKKAGYRIQLYFLWLPDVNLAIQRVRDRVRRGGHSIPEDDIRRRYGRGLKNLFLKYRPLLDQWVIFDNSGEKSLMVVDETHGRLQVLDAPRFNAITKIWRTDESKENVVKRSVVRT